MKRLIAIAALTALFMGGCAAMNFYKKVDVHMGAGQFAEADKIIEESKNNYKGEHELLYYFDKGSILQMMGEYKESTKYLEEAELKVESLYTKSATQHIGSFLTNDMSLPYEGEDFEQVMINVLKCLNFLYAGDASGAQVEARKVNNRLNLINDRYEGKSIYKQDAFARYLSAIAFELKGDYNDAYIDYKKSLEGYTNYASLYGTEIPGRVKQDILRTAEAVRFYDDVERYKKEFGIQAYTKHAEARSKAEVIFVVYDGMAPYKVSKNVNAATKDKNGKPYVIKVAFPSFVPRGSVVNSVAVDGTDSGFDAENISAIAMKNLEHKNGLIYAKAVARAAAKYFASQALSNNGKNSTMSLLMNIYTYASEQADTRSWRTLPSRFIMIRKYYEPGKKTVKVTLDTVSGKRELPFNLKLKAGAKKVIPIYAFN
ncbi:MAG: hypothetical protein JXR81_06840 [Candidatus Goldbacteria bacterium]|nr:hypothetical protein [Candidatus Goldiibacteriota bacterium]